LDKRWIVGLEAGGHVRDLMKDARIARQCKGHQTNGNRVVVGG
jgi:hypothetical protein